MGWDFCEAWLRKADVVAEQSRAGRYGPGSHVLASRTTRHGVWLVWENGADRFIELNLIEKQDGCYGVKSMGAEMGPYYYDCPVEFLALVPENSYSKQWAEGVKAMAAKIQREVA